MSTGTSPVWMPRLKNGPRGLLFEVLLRQDLRDSTVKIHYKFNYWKEVRDECRVIKTKLVHQRPDFYVIARKFKKSWFYFAALNFFKTSFRTDSALSSYWIKQWARIETVPLSRAPVYKIQNITIFSAFSPACRGRQMPLPPPRPRRRGAAWLEGPAGPTRSAGWWASA